MLGKPRSMIQLLRLPLTELTPDVLADWAELSCLFGSHRTLSGSVIADFLQEELALDDAEDFAVGGAGGADEGISDEVEHELRAASADALAEGLNPLSQTTELVLRQLSYREQVVGPNYPLTIGDFSVRRKSDWVERPSYPFLCLLNARVLYKRDWDFHEPARLFEQVVAQALGKLVAGTAVRFGWPRLQDEPVEDFNTKVRQLARRMGEDVGRMRNIGPDVKDYDLDVIAWKPFRDGKTPGQLVVVCQCAIGTDWSSKLLSVSSWQEVIAFNTTPVGALAFPLIPSRDPALMFRWHDVTSKGNLPLDRLRLASLLDDDRLPPDLKDRLRAWIDDRTQELPIVN